MADTSAGQPLPPKARRHKTTNEPRFDARTPLSRLAGVDLTTIEGIEENTALLILSEIGTDMHKPGHNILSAGAELIDCTR